MIAIPIVKAVTCCWMVIPLALGDELPVPPGVAFGSNHYMNLLKRRILEEQARLAAIENMRTLLEMQPLGDQTKEIERLRQREFFLSREIIRYKRELSRYERSVIPLPQSYMPVVPRVPPKLQPKPKVWD